MAIRAVTLGAVVALLVASPAGARGGDVMELGSAGARVERERLLPAPDPPAPAGLTAAADEPRATASRAGFRSALRRLLDAGRIDRAHYDEALGAWSRAQRALPRLRGRRFAELRAVLVSVDAIAARGALTAGRLTAIGQTVDRNRQWWSCGPLVAPGTRVRFTGSRLLWQAYPGAGMQLQWLGNFGLANGLWQSETRDAELGELLDEAVALAAPRAGGIAWESLFAFGGGRPTWVSGLTQGTAVQALARASVRLRRPELIEAGRAGLGVFRRAAPEGVRLRTSAGAHYLQYSFAPRLRILNGFVQAVNGLHDFAKLAGDPAAQELFAAGERQARIEVPRSNTGRWSLYDERHESTVDYHKLLRQFVLGLYERTGTAVYKRTADAFLRQLRRRQAASPGTGTGTAPAPRTPLAPQAPCRERT